MNRIRLFPPKSVIGNNNECSNKPVEELPKSHYHIAVIRLPLCDNELTMGQVIVLPLRGNCPTRQQACDCLAKLLVAVVFLHVANTNKWLRKTKSIVRE